MSATVARISPRDRVAFVGKTGAGKTFLARSLLRSVKRLVVFDSKGTLGAGAGWNLTDWSWANERRLRWGRAVRLRVPAPLDGDWEEYFRACYDARNVTLYIDEAYGVLGPGRRPGLYLTACYTRGRELGIGVWAATQRPSWIPLFMLSEAEWLFVFRLQLEEDRRRIASIIGSSGMRNLHGHNVIVYNQAWDDGIWYERARV